MSCEITAGSTAATAAAARTATVAHYRRLLTGRATGAQSARPWALQLELLRGAGSRTLEAVALDAPVAATAAAPAPDGASPGLLLGRGGRPVKTEFWPLQLRPSSGMIGHVGSDSTHIRPQVPLQAFARGHAHDERLGRLCSVAHSSRVRRLHEDRADAGRFVT